MDESRAILAVPYAIVEQAHGVALSTLDLAPEQLADSWRALGCDLARLHSGVAASAALAQHGADIADLDPRPWLMELEAIGALAPPAAAMLRGWLEWLAPFALAPRPRHFCHGDVNSGNILVDPGTYAYCALVDWDGAMWGDSAYDLAVVSLGAAPWLVQGYRSVAEAASDTTLEARVIWQHLRLALYGMRRAPQRDMGWMDRRLARLFEGMRVLLASAPAAWLAERGAPEPP